MLLLDAPWIGVLCLLAGTTALIAGVVRVHRIPEFVLAGLAWPLAGIRDLPWLGRSLRHLTGQARAPRVLVTAIWSVLAVLVFGLLFVSADAIVESWVDAVLPDISVDTVVLRVFIAVAVAGPTLAAAYLALNPPRTDAYGVLPRAAVGHRFEWLVPVLLVDAVFAVFVAAQLSVFFGGHDYVQRTTGLTYAEYVHQGFGQLTVATLLTLLVVWAASHWAGDTFGDRVWLRASLGVLCALTLVVVGSALYRMHLYQEAYGFTQLRLLVDVFEGWLGVVVLAVAVAGLVRWGVWLPRFALISGVVALLGVAAINPDAWIAERNLDRYADTGRVDWHFLRNLSADAVPVFDGRAGDRGHVRDAALLVPGRRLALVEPRPEPRDRRRRRRPGGDGGGPGDGPADGGRPHDGRLPGVAPARIVPDRCVARTGRRPRQTSRTIPASGRSTSANPLAGTTRRFLDSPTCPDRTPTSTPWRWPR